MPVPTYSAHRDHLNTIRRAIHAAADPAQAMERTLAVAPGQLLAGERSFPLKPTNALYLIAFGKASSAMTQAAINTLGDRISGGVVAIPSGGSLSAAGMRVFHGGHPLPDQGSLAAGKAVGELLARTHPGDLVLVLISGGGSAMLEWPLPGVQLQDLRRLTELLLQCGAPIEDINIVRKALSRTKAGGIARLAAPARCISLILSDVVGDRLTAIASGPTVLRRVTPEDARRVLMQYHIWDKAPDRIKSTLSLPLRSAVRSPRPHNVLIGSNRLALSAAAAAAEHLGFAPQIVSRQMHGEARSTAARFTRALLRVRPGTCLLMGGETTVTIQGTGTGGRNQEFALAASLLLPAQPPRAVMSLATDGVDGPTDAAGAIVTSETRQLAKAAHLDVEAALDNNDSYNVLDPLNALIRTGPSGTNVNDIVVGLTYT